MLGDDRQVHRVLRVPVERLFIREVRDQHGVAVPVHEAGVLCDDQGFHAADVLAEAPQRLDRAGPLLLVGVGGPGEDHDMSDHVPHPASRPPGDRPGGPVTGW